MNKMNLCGFVSVSFGLQNAFLVFPYFPILLPYVCKICRQSVFLSSNFCFLKDSSRDVVIVLRPIFNTFR